MKEVFHYCLKFLPLLFITSCSYSDERAFDSILDDMIDHNLALKAVIKDQQLLVFSSRELPPDHWRKLNNHLCFVTSM